MNERYSHNLHDLFASFANGVPVMLMGTIDGEPSTIEGLVNAMMREDGSGLNWLVTVSGHDRPILIRTYPFSTVNTARRIHLDK